MSESKTNVIHADNGTSAQECSESNVANEMLLNVNEPKTDTNQNIKLSDDESSSTVGEINADKCIDVEEGVTNQNVENESSNNGINEVNNDHSEENVDETLSGQPTTANEPHARTSERTHCRRRPKHRPKFVYSRRHAPRPEPVKKTAHGVNLTNSNRPKNQRPKDHTTYFPCGHIKKMGATLLKHIGIKTPKILKDSSSLDQKILKTHRYIYKLPTIYNVNYIFNDYRRKKNACPEVTDILLMTFDLILPKWCLHFIETLQYDEICRKLPNYKMSEMYGLAHLIRFIGFLPRIFNTLGPKSLFFREQVAIYMNGFMDYLVEENLRVDFFRDYYLILPEYHRMIRFALNNARRGHSQSQ